MIAQNQHGNDLIFPSEPNHAEGGVTLRYVALFFRLMTFVNEFRGKWCLHTYYDRKLGYRVVGELADNVSDCNLSDIMSFGTSGAMTSWTKDDSSSKYECTVIVLLCQPSLFDVSINPKINTVKAVKCLCTCNETQTWKIDFFQQTHDVVHQKSYSNAHRR